MRCPFCGETETKVIDSRDAENQTRRRRECEKCEKRFTTYEKVDNINLIVIKKDGRKETFDIQKIRNGIMKACEKRVDMDKINEIVDEVEQKLRSYEENEIPSKKIGEEIMKLLKKTDKISYIRFASVYRDFTDVEEFKEEIDKLIMGGKK